MINNVRKTVLSILNKNNYGYISPDDFNMYARVAQREIFEDYFHRFNKENNKINARMSGSGHADIQARINGEVDKFTVVEKPSFITDNQFALPSPLTNGDDMFKIVSVTTEQQAGDGTYFFKAEASKVSNLELRRLGASNLLGAASYNPMYTVNGDTFTMAGDNYVTNEVVLEYIRYPRDPKWTYLNIGAGEPIFDQTANDYQDFEIGEAEETELINKILQMAGMSIRDIQAVQAAGQEEVERKTEQQ